MVMSHPDGSQSWLHEKESGYVSDSHVNIVVHTDTPNGELALFGKHHKAVDMEDSRSELEKTRPRGNAHQLLPRGTDLFSQSSSR